MKYIDLTHTFKKEMPVYPGDSKPKLEQIAFLNKDSYNNFQIKTSMHIGTHIDAPLHMVKNGKQISDILPEQFFGKGHIIDARNRIIDENLLKGMQILKGDIVFIMTGLYKKFGTTEYYESYPEVSNSFALKMIELGVSILGMDTPSPDRPPFLIHKLLLEKDVLIIENLTNLELLLEHKQFDVIALPIKLNTEASPVRVIAKIN